MFAASRCANSAGNLNKADSVSRRVKKLCFPTAVFTAA